MKSLKYLLAGFAFVTAVALAFTTTASVEAEVLIRPGYLPGDCVNSVDCGSAGGFTCVVSTQTRYQQDNDECDATVQTRDF